SFIFFFQAEDGIRDATVTGVQTCALPISSRAACWSARSTSASGRVTDDGAGAAPPVRLAGALLLLALSAGAARAQRRPPPQPARSEERRVGKEARWRRWRESA